MQSLDSLPSLTPLQQAIYETDQLGLSLRDSIKLVTARMGFFVGQHKYLDERAKIARLMGRRRSTANDRDSMQIGIAGLPGAGKTTLFNALAHQHASVGGYAGAEPNLAVVKVPDERLDRLSALFQPKKHTPAEVRFVDVAGVAKGMGQESSAAVLAHLRTVDVLLHVIGAFQSEQSARSEFEDFSLELQLADLAQIEKRVDRLEKELRLGSKGTPAERAAKERELGVLRRLATRPRGGRTGADRSLWRQTRRRRSPALAF